MFYIITPEPSLRKVCYLLTKPVLTGPYNIALGLIRGQEVSSPVLSLIWPITEIGSGM